MLWKSIGGSVLLLALASGTAHDVDHVDIADRQLPDLLRKADAGDIEASKTLASYWLDIKLDVATASKFLERAAVLGDVTAQYNLAVLLLTQGGAENVESAIDWFELAAKKGDAEASAQLAIANRAGSARDITAAEKASYELAARNGSADAMEKLLKHAKGSDDNKEVVRWAIDLCVYHARDPIQHRTYQLLLRDAASSMTARRLSAITSQAAKREGCLL